MMVANLKSEMKRQYPKSSLTVATFVDAATNTRIHDIESLSKNVDGIVIMGYDFYTPNSKQIGAIAPLEGKDYSITRFLDDYLKKSPANKLILAVPYYGYDWPVGKVAANTSVSGTRADVRVYPYGEIVDSTQKTQINWDADTQTPWYSYTDPKTKKSRVVHFENTRSLGLKYDYINAKGMQGVGVWAMGYDGRRTELIQLIADKFAN